MRGKSIAIGLLIVTLLIAVLTTYADLRLKRAGINTSASAEGKAQSEQQAPPEPQFANSIVAAVVEPIPERPACACRGPEANSFQIPANARMYVLCGGAVHASSLRFSDRIGVFTVTGGVAQIGADCYYETNLPSGSPHCGNVWIDRSDPSIDLYHKCW